MGGVRKFFIESKFFHLVLEEGGRYFMLRIFERGKFFMRSVFMGRNAAQWLMSSIEHLVIGVSSKQFFIFREGDTAFTLQWSYNSAGQFLLLTELKAGGSRRSIIIPEGKESLGWRAFGLELRKLLNPSQYAVGGNGFPKFIPQVRRSNLEAVGSRTFAEVVQGLHGRIEERKQPKQLGTIAKRKLPQIGEEKMGANLRISGVKEGDLPVVKYDRMEVVGGARRELCSHEVAEVGEQNLADTRLRFPSFNLNSKDFVMGKKSDARKSCWSGRGLVVEVDVMGRRRVFWDRKKGGDTKCRGDSRESGRETSKAFKWIQRNSNQAVVKPFMGLGTSPVTRDGLFSGPSFVEVGESSWAGEGALAQVPLEAELESGVLGQCTSSSVMPLLASGEADGFTGTSSGEPTPLQGKDDDPSCAGTCSDELAVAQVVADAPFSADACSDELAVAQVVADGPSCAGACSEERAVAQVVADELAVAQVTAGGFFSAGTCSDELVVAQVKADGHFFAGISPVLPSFLMGKADDSFLVGTSSDESTSSLGKSDILLPWSPVEGFLQGGLDNSAVPPKTALIFEQPRLAELPTMALSVVPGVCSLVEEGVNFSDMGLGGEVSSPIPLLAITPGGLPLSDELNRDNQAVECVDTLDTSRWVKNRLPGFSKLVGLPLCRHEKLCIALLQKLERETEAAKVLNRKVTESRKVVIYKDKGKRELRNLQSSVNYDGR
ncbi:uncharacterized protein LOC126709524 isoform X2 [Quercus robur]|uniref:uncharacterized protein LOC126709524 isoform X2 n=1 Tax=Quercus robur TaxID=38942 RepID=UPI0021625F1A|nr:uncharacterized protein LOC126709524 isoform X2 [Quercus robur]